MRLHRYEQNFCYIDLTINYNCSWSPRNFLVGLEGLFPGAYKKLSETELYDSSVGQLHHRLMSHRPMANPQTLSEASTNYSWTRTGYWQEKILFLEENCSLWVSDYWFTSPCAHYHNLIYYVNISSEEMMDIILSNTAHSMFFQKIDIDVMHKHDDKHPAWLESEISISVLIHCRRFVPRRTWCVKADVNE